MSTSSISKEITERDKVIVGADGWLFLGNDSNNSTAQFVGEINLSQQSLERFTIYLKALKTKIACDFFFSISPNKEFVHPEKYPYVMREKSNGNALIHEQVISALEDCDIKYHYPAKELAEIPNSYYKTDTHWSEYGAYKTLSSFLLSNYDINLIALNLKDFFLEHVSGDLGSKLNGQEDGRLSYNLNISKYEVFNSSLNNNGFGSHYINNDAPNQRKILVFGDSFGFSYVEPLVLTFKEVVFLYSPAAFIENIYESFEPDIVILQINQRFLTNPPRYHFNIEKSPAFRKLRGLSSYETENFIKNWKKTNVPSILRDLFMNGLSIISTDENSKNFSRDAVERSIVFNGDYIETRANIFENERKNIVITFTARSDKPHKSGFAEIFFEKNSISAIHFISKSNHWWQISEMQDAIEKVKPFLIGYQNIFTYGASMGGHGALIFSKPLGANHIIAGSPQYAIKGRLTPWTPRWTRDTKDVNELFPIEQGLARTAKIYCIYDPFNDFDRQHVNEINKLAHINRIKTSFSGHSAVMQLKNLGVLSALLKSIIETPKSLSDVIKDMKNRRPTSLNYLNGLGIRASTHTHRKKVSSWAKRKAFLIAKETVFDKTSSAVSHTDISPIFKSYCLELIQNNHTDNAVSFAQEYCQKFPEVYFTYDLLSYVYWKAKKFTEALLASKRALRLNRQNPSLRISVARLHIALEQYDDALYHLDIALGFPSKDKKSWIALHNDLKKSNIPLDIKIKVLNKLKEIDPSYENK